MKVLLVNKFHYRKGGSETFCFTLAEALRQRGHQVIFFAMEDKERNLPCPQEPYFVSNASVGGSIKSRLNMILHIAYSREAYVNMKALLEAEQPDLVVFNLVHRQITLSIIDAVREFKKRIPIFWVVHDLIMVCPSYVMLDGKGQICEDCLKGSFWPCVRKSCIKGSKLMSLLAKYEADYIRKRKWYDQIDLFICPSAFYQNRLKKAGFTAGRIEMLRNPLSSEVFGASGGVNGRYMLYFGRLSKEKGLYLLIEGAKKAGCRLVILGTGPEEEKLKQFAGPDSRIEFKGFQRGERLREMVQNCCCVVLPSIWYENGPYSAMEAMAMGKPLIVSDCGGLPELVEDGKNGYIFNTEEGADGLCSCIQRIQKMGEESYRQMCKAAAVKAKEMFDPEEYVKKIEGYYQEFTDVD